MPLTVFLQGLAALTALTNCRQLLTAGHSFNSFDQLLTSFSSCRQQTQKPHETFKSWPQYSLRWFGYKGGDFCEWGSDKARQRLDLGSMNWTQTIGKYGITTGKKGHNIATWLMDVHCSWLWLWTDPWYCAHGSDQLAEASHWEDVTVAHLGIKMVEVFPVGWYLFGWLGDYR